MRYFLCSLLFLFVLSLGCAPKSVHRPNLSAMADTTDECKYMDRVCYEAEQFQKEFNSFSEEARDELIPALNGYIENCEGAAELCNESLK